MFNNNGSNKQLAGTPEWTSLHTLCKQMSTLPRAVQTDSELCPLLVCVFYTLPCIRLALNSSLQHFSLKAIHPPSLPLPTLCLLLKNADFLFFSAVLYSSARASSIISSADAFLVPCCSYPQISVTYWILSLLLDASDHG